MAIFQRLLLAFLGVGVLIGAPLILVALDFSRDSARLRTEQSVTQQIAIVAANFEQEFGVGLNRSLKQITSSDALTQYLAASQDERMVNARGLETSFLKSQADYEIYSGIYYVDVFGQLIASVQDGKRVTWSAEEQPADKTGAVDRTATPLHLKRLFDRITTTPSLLSSGNMEWFMPPRQMVVEGPFIDEQGRWSLLAGLPSLDFDNGALSGAAVIRVRLDTFLSRLKTITLFDEQVIWLFGPSAQTLLQPQKTDLALTRADVGDQALVKEVVLSKRDEDLLAYRDLSIVPDQPFLRIVYGVPYSLLSRDFEPALYFFIMVLGVSGIVVMTVAYFVAKNFSAPIIELAQAAARLARGELAGRVKVSSSGELMVLVDSFNRMSENLQRANETRSNAFEVLRKTAAQMQLPDAVEASRQVVAAKADDSDVPAPGQEDAQDLRAISELITQLIGERAENLRSTREARDSAEQANRAKSQFLANMSHEIRTPLNAVLGMLKLLQSTSLTPRQFDYVAKTEGAARSLLFLLNDILDFSKVEADKMSLDPRPFRIDQLMRDLSVILSANIGSKPVEVLFDIDPAVPRTLIGDDLRLQQVLINLGGNAIKFTERGEVVVALRCASLQAQRAVLDFSVRDTGIGIPADQHVRIFDGFSQAEASTTRRFGGTGLGLAICQRLVSLMGGHIAVDSQPGVGSTFSFQVSLPIDMQAQAALESSQEMLRGLTNLRALVVDDNPTARQVLSEMVASLGWRVDVAASGPEAVALARRQYQQGEPYDVAFVDWQMPGMDGWETSLRMREAQGPSAAATVMMVTAYGREMLSGRSAAEQASMGGFLVKPVTASMLLDAVISARSAQPASDGALNAQAVLPGPAPVDRPRRLLGLRLLIVEDNANNRQVAEELLRAEGAEVELAENGQIGLDRLESAGEPFDAVLMDLQMPVMDGFTATAQLRGQERWATLPIIAMTANALDSDRQACLDAGMTDHVGKPFDLDDLVATLLKHARPDQAPAAVGTAAASIVPALPEPALRIATAMGLDVLPAVQRLGGNVGAYGRMWRNFLQDLGPLRSRVEGQLAQGHWAEAAAEFHTLKGLAGMLGQTALVALCRQAEAELVRADQTPPAQAWLQPLFQLIGRLDELGPGLVDTLLAQPPGQTGQPLDDVAQVCEALSALSLLLEASDMKAVDAFEPLRSSPLLMNQGLFAELCVSMDRLDFDRAGRLVSDLMKAVNT